jgi:hypothetical protein
MEIPDEMAVPIEIDDATIIANAMTRIAELESIVAEKEKNINELQAMILADGKMIAGMRPFVCYHKGVLCEGKNTPEIGKLYDDELIKAKSRVVAIECMKSSMEAATMI